MYIEVVMVYFIEILHFMDSIHCLNNTCFYYVSWFISTLKIAWISNMIYITGLVLRYAYQKTNRDIWNVEGFHDSQ